MTPELLARAAAHGLTYNEDGERRWWGRAGPLALVWLVEGFRWAWEPESTPYDALWRAPRFGTEAEALSAALNWLDAGEPELGVPR